MIRELKQKGWKITAIAKETGFDRKTIRKYLNSDTVPHWKKRATKGSILDLYKPYILGSIKEGTTNYVVLLEEIQKLGYEGEKFNPSGFCKCSYRAATKKQATVRFETKPGRQAQEDQAENVVEFLVEGVKRPFICLPYDSKLFKKTIYRIYNRYVTGNFNEMSY